MPTAYSFIRFSSKPQERGHSVKRQLKLTTALCAKHKLKLDNTLFTPPRRIKAKSAYHGDHLKPGGDLARFVQAVKDEKVKPGSWLVLESPHHRG